MVESGFLSLKVTTWTKQYNAAAHRDIPAMNELSDWLTSNLPATDNEVTLVHGDFRLDNLIFHPTEVWVLEQPPFQNECDALQSCVWCHQTRVIAVLDWELSTTGQPLADLAYFLMYHYWPANLRLHTMGSLKGIEGDENKYWQWTV